MDTRELEPEEWVAFFEAFSRHYRGRPVTLDVVPPPGRADGPACVIARRVPLLGIAAEPHAGVVRSIEIIVGHLIGDDHLVHVVNAPRRVRVGQISNGEDETLTIESAADPTVRVDFSLAPTDAAERNAIQWVADE